MNIEEKLSAMGLKLPSPPIAGGIYKPVVIASNLLYISGQGPLLPDGSLIKGVVGNTLSVEEGRMAARQTGLTMLATIRHELGDLTRIHRLIKTLGMVNCVPGFGEQPAVINGFSELMVEVLGEEHGKGTRSAVGMVLPGGIATEIEAIFELN